MEVKFIVDNAIEELKSKGLDSFAIERALDYWSEISGINVKSIDETTPFDIEIVNKLLSTFPSVISKISEFKEEAIEIPEFSIEDIKESETIEDLDKELEMLMSALSSSEEVIEEIEEVKPVSEGLEKELQQLAFSLAKEEEEKPKLEISQVKGIRLAAVISDGKIEKFYISKETEYKPNLNKLTETIINLWSFVGLNLYDFSSFHLKLGDLILYVEKKEGKIYIVLVETETIGGAKFFVYGLERA
ncbi:MAG: hypothetical protein ABIL49_08300 [candidate division WOR-3 bacterium]|jgi:hypothetical protein